MIIPFLLAVALSIPPKVAEVPVSAPVLQRQPGDQNGQRIASNGTLALCAWNDNRAVVAARIDANGTPLDLPGKIVIADGVLRDVFWNGDAFVVVLSEGRFVFVDADGSVVGEVTVDSTLGAYATNTSEGSSTRVLLLPQTGKGSATVLDAKLEIVRKGDDVPGGAEYSAWNGRHFVTVRGVLVPPDVFHVSDILDRDGRVLSSAPTGLFFNFAAHYSALAGDARGGFVFLLGRTMYALDEHGIVAGAPVTLQEWHPIESPTGPFATMTKDGFVVAWGLNLPTGHALSFVSCNGREPEQTHDWEGKISSVVVDAATRLVATAEDSLNAAQEDVFVQSGRAEPQLVTRSAALQALVSISGGSNGFLAAWVEITESGVRLMARPVSESGAPQGEPVEMERRDLAAYQSTNSPRIVFADGVYLIAWTGDARRLDARTGEWIDDEPFPLGNILGLASNREEAMAVVATTCNSQACTVAQPVAMHGDPLAGSCGSALRRFVRRVDIRNFERNGLPPRCRRQAAAQRHPVHSRRTGDPNPQRRHAHRRDAARALD